MMNSLRFTLNVFLVSMSLGCVLLVACDSGSQGDAGDLEHAISDTRVMEDATTAANDLIRNASDCDAVRSAFGDVERALNEAEQAVTTATGRTALAALRRQVSATADACGAR